MDNSACLRVALAMVLLLGAVFAGEAPILALKVDRAILRLEGDSGGTASAQVRVIPEGFSASARLAYRWEQIADEMSASPASLESGKRAVIAPQDGGRAAVTFRTWGVHLIRVTVTDAASGLEASRNAWFQVWDNRSHIVVDGVPDPLAIAPGITPPPRVRDLSPEPGPFHHPRLFCRDSDWPEIHQRCVAGTSRLASGAYRSLAPRFAKQIAANDRVGRLLRGMEAYADGGYRAEDLPEMSFAAGDDPSGKSVATLKREQEVAEQAVDAVTQALADACFVQWIRTDPAQAQELVPADEQAMSRRLAKLVAAFCHASLTASWDPETGRFFKGRPGYLTNIEEIGGTCTRRAPLAVAYDFIAPWMTPKQLQATRDLLVATGPGRVTTSRGNAWVREGIVADRGISRGYSQNGNYAAFAEAQVLKALVVAGEEGAADPRVVKTFLTPEKPANFTDRKKIFPYDWSQPTTVDTGRDCPASRPYGPSMSWPHARKVDADNLLRSIFWNQDGNTSPWGFLLEREAYYATTVEQWQTALVFARFGANNQFVSGTFYPIVNQMIYNAYTFGSPWKSASFSSIVQPFNHHAGATGQSNLHTILLKYMYPDDPAVDYVYAARAPWLENRSSPLMMCLFGSDPGIRDLAGALTAIAKEKELPLTKLDPEEGMVVLRSSWADDALMIDLDAGFKGCGHMNAEKNSFALFALGRSWALPVGFHKVYSNWQSGIQVQNPAWATCPMTQGYVGENPNFPPDVPNAGMPRSFPTPPGKLLEVRESADGSWSLAAADATAAYNFMCSAEGERLGLPRADFMYPGLLPEFVGRCPFVQDIFVANLSASYRAESKDFIRSPWTAVAHAIRTLVLVRGSRPYVLVVDDFRKGTEPANYRWMMNNPSREEDGKTADRGSFRMIMEPGATPTEAILVHRPDQGAGTGKPRLLVRDVSEADRTGQPAMRMDQTKFKAPKGMEADFYLNEEANRLFIDRQQVVDPRYKILLFPFRTGESLPTTTWNAARTELTIDLGKGMSDTISFTAGADQRTRISVRHGT